MGYRDLCPYVYTAGKHFTMESAPQPDINNLVKEAFVLAQCFRGLQPITTIKSGRVHGGRSVWQGLFPMTAVTVLITNWTQSRIT